MRYNPDAGMKPIDTITSTLMVWNATNGGRDNAIKGIWGFCMSLISSTKSMIGHAMGASGALEAIICAVIANG
jgi:3-oxoacyl-(acyl-carrier-protein) synthase